MRVGPAVRPEKLNAGGRVAAFNAEDEALGAGESIGFDVQRAGGKQRIADVINHAAGAVAGGDGLGVVQPLGRRAVADAEPEIAAAPGQTVE